MERVTPIIEQLEEHWWIVYNVLLHRLEILLAGTYCNCKRLIMKNFMGQQNKFNEKSKLPAKLLQRLQIEEMNSRKVKVEQWQ